MPANTVQTLSKRLGHTALRIKLNNCYLITKLGPFKDTSKDIYCRDISGQNPPASGRGHIKLQRAIRRGHRVAVPTSQYDIRSPSSLFEKPPAQAQRSFGLAYYKLILFFPVFSWIMLPGLRLIK